MDNNNNKSNLSRIIDAIIEALTKDRFDDNKFYFKHGDVIVTLIFLIFAGGFFLIIYISLPHDSYDRNSGFYLQPKLTVEKYEDIVNQYGDAATALVNDYMINNNSIPNFDDIASDITIPKYHVSCSNRNVYPNGSVYLSNCVIRGYKTDYYYEYGEFYDNVESDASKKIYFYKKIQKNGFTVVSQNYHSTDIDGYKYIGDYTCTNKNCRTFYKPTLNCYWVVIFDGDKRLLYDPDVKTTIVLESLFIPVTSSISVIADSYGGPISVALVDGMNRLAYINIDANQLITDFGEYKDVTLPSLADKNLLAMKSKNTDDLVILSAIDGHVIQTINNYLDYEYITENFTSYYAVKYTDSKYNLFDSSFNLFMGIKEHYNYSANYDKNVILTFDNYFINVDFDGNILYKSSLYNQVIGAVKDYVVVRTDDEILILSSLGDIVTKFLDYKDLDRYKYTNDVFISYEHGETCIAYMVIDTTFEPNEVGYYLQYTYNINTGSIRKDTFNYNKAK